MRTKLKFETNPNTQQCWGTVELDYGGVLVSARAYEEAWNQYNNAKRLLLESEHYSALYGLDEMAAYYVQENPKAVDSKFLGMVGLIGGFIYTLHCGSDGVIYYAPTHIGLLGASKLPCPMIREFQELDKETRGVRPWYAAYENVATSGSVSIDWTAIRKSLRECGNAIVKGNFKKPLVMWCILRT